MIGHQHENTRTHKQEVLTGQYTTQPESMAGLKGLKDLKGQFKAITAESLEGFELKEEVFKE